MKKFSFKKLKKLLKNFKLKFVNSKKDYLTINYFIYLALLLNPKSIIIQIGANDGKTSDPLYRFIKHFPSSVFYRLEPLKHYANQLKLLHNNQTNVHLIEYAVTSFNAPLNLPFYFVDNKVIELMNGEGPNDNWGLGQCSFRKKVIQKTIEANKFRGPRYVKNINKFINAIKTTSVKQVNMNDLFSLIKILSLDILIIDVLGYEYEILKDIEKWNILPKVIIYEDNVFMTKGEREKCTEVLISSGYKLFLNDGDKVFCKLDLDQLLR